MNTLPRMHNLPPEIQDLIIDQLQGDSASLRSCSLACRAWLPRARHHLFRSVRIDRCTRGEHFKDLIDTSPSIAQHIRHVELSGMKGECWWLGEDGMTRLPGWWPTLGQRMQRHSASTTWETVDWLQQGLPESTVAFNKVTRLSLSSLHVSAAIADVLRPYFPGITELVINGCQGLAFSDFIELCSAFPRVRSVRFAEARWLPTTSPIPDQFSPNSATTVTTLEFSRKIDIVTVFDWLLRSGRYSQITSLSCFVTSHAGAKAIKSLLEALGPNLQHLGVGFSDVRDPTEILKSCDLTLKPCKGLRTIHVSCATTERFSTYRQSLSWLLLLLSRVSSPVIEGISLLIPQKDISALNLDGLIAVLSHIRYQSLKRLVFDVEVPMEPILKERDIRTRLSVLDLTLKFNAICP